MFASRRPTRDYTYPWTNQWYEEKCNPAVVRLAHAQRHRRRDWRTCSRCTTACTTGRTTSASPRRPTTCRTSTSDRGGLRRTTPEQRQRAGRRHRRRPPDFAARTTPTRSRLPDGVAAITNMYLWQPIPAASTRRASTATTTCRSSATSTPTPSPTAWSAARTPASSAPRRGAMGESWSDLVGHRVPARVRLRPAAARTRSSIGAYVTGDTVAGIRNYGMNQSPLNYCDVGYDLVGPQVHADGEIWSATTSTSARRWSAVRRRHARRRSRPCADGERAADRVPGQPPLDAAGVRRLPADGRPARQHGRRARRDARGRPDALRRRQPGAAVERLRPARPGRRRASSNATEDADPMPGFDVAVRRRGAPAASGRPATRPAGAGAAVRRATTRPGSTPVADTDPATPLGRHVASSCRAPTSCVVRADGFGHVRFDARRCSAGQLRDLHGAACRPTWRRAPTARRRPATASTSTS